jgi:cell division protein FtsZ
MISYSRDPKQEIPTSSVKILGLGGAGANMLERIALDSQEGAQLVSLNTDMRTLSASLAKEKIQLGITLTKGLGTGGDPELGQQAVLEAETEVRNVLKDQKIVFLCVGLGGGTGSGAAPIIARIAREEGAFVIVFATMPFLFEGSRRREQAETALNQLAVLSNALVTFDNNRMGELVLAKQGIHEAFGAADKMISESIKAVIRLVVKPGLIHVGLDELITALRTTRSRCLFGSGIADGKDRASKALRNALSSPLLDQGALLKDAQSVLVHLSGGESLTLFEIELLMQSLQKHVPDHTQILFGAAIDPSMGDYLSITLISSLPEEALVSSTPSAPATPAPEPVRNIPSPAEQPEPQRPILKLPEKIIPEPRQPKLIDEIFENFETQAPQAQPTPKAEVEAAPSLPKEDHPDLKHSNYTTVKADQLPKDPPKTENYDRPFAEPELIPSHPTPAAVAHAPTPPAPIAKTEVKPEPPVATPSPPAQVEQPKPAIPVVPVQNEPSAPLPREPKVDLASSFQLKLDPKNPADQDELSFKKTPRGRFEGENPNVLDGEDLDLPPFLRKKK